MHDHKYYENKLKKYLVDNSIEAEHLSFEESCHSVQEAAAVVKADPKDFVKSICMFDENGNLYVGIVKGEDRVSISQSEKSLNVKGLRLANPDEMLEKTGYPCGGTPGFGFNAKFIIDPKVLEKEFIYMGGGSQQSLIKISPKELQRLNHAEILKLKK